MSNPQEYTNLLEIIRCT